MVALSIWTEFENNNTTQLKVIDITDELNADMKQRYKNVHRYFWKEVKHLAKLLLETDAILVVANSLGKDSSVTLQIALEAYREAKRYDPEFNKPLIINTIDTLIEELPNKFYANYTIPKIEGYAVKSGINLVYNRVSPSRFNSWVFRYIGARKFFNNATRAGDCTDILKLAPMRKQMAIDKQTYSQYQFIQLVGSRIQESSRRSGNMGKAGLKQRTIERVREKLLKSSSANISYAPIRYWSADDVFACLRLSGEDALVKTSFSRPIPSFQPHSGLLIEIYGDASTPETCQVNISDDGDEMNTSCGSSKSGRMGCTFCTIVTENKSAHNFALKPRWKSLHIDKALRIRDYIYRLSMNTHARSFHARSIDPVLNRVMLQQNTLKPKYLERIYRLLCQLTKDSYDTASELYWGEIEDFEGYLDIKNDMSMNEKTRSEFLNMYRQEAVKHHYNLISKEDAILLSFIWALDGVGSFNYAPIGIYDEVFEKNKRVPYPPLNSEMPYNVKLKSTPVLDAYVLRTMSSTFEKSDYLAETFNQCHSYSDPTLLALAENCAESLLKPKDTLKLNVKFSPKLSHRAGGTRLVFDIDSIQIQSTQRSYTELKRFSAIMNEIKEQCLNRLLMVLPEWVGSETTKIDSDSFHINCLPSTISAAINDCILPTFETTVELRNIAVSLLNSTPTLSGRKRTQKHLTETTKRIRKGSVIGNTRLRFYPVRLKSALTMAHSKTVPLLTQSLEHVQKIDLNIHDEFAINQLSLDAIYLDSDYGELYWFELDGYERALKEYYYDRELYKAQCKKRLHYGKYNGIKVLRSMMQYGGITISQTYQSEMIRIMGRTIALHSQRAFKYADMTITQLNKQVELGNLISMKQHRRDKANHLLKVKKARAIDRKETKEQLAAFVANDAMYVVEAFVKPKIEALYNACSGGNSKTQDFLLGFYQDQRNGYLEFEKEFLSTAESKLIASNPKAQKMAIECYDQLFGTKSLTATINAKLTIGNKATLITALL
ncbi:hypothetical protein [Vibrio harveyi]|uniref:hypothetical protein n=1 Tax=Vibrio harveyi TaxID=669 RepID=UPI002480401D|nr:hypothetical protein [Vibrio harveyi]